MTAKREFGGYAAAALGLEAIVDGDKHGIGLPSLAGVALRRNPRRAHLIVSRVLAKHIPVDGCRAVTFGHLLANEVSGALRHAQRGVVVIGFCETATGLGHLVAEGLDAPYVHTTRDRRNDAPVWIEFAEPHSHAPAHLILSAAAPLIQTAGVIVLVDDELSTGTTALNLIRAIEAASPGKSYILATLLDLRPTQERDDLTSNAHAAGLDVRCVSLISGTVTVADDAIDRVRNLVSANNWVRSPLSDVGGFRRLDVDCVPDGRMGVQPRTHLGAVDTITTWLERNLPNDGRVLVVGTEETMFIPIKVAAQYGCDVQSTSRSPVVVGQFDDDYPVRSGVTFASCYDPSVPAYLYNGLSGEGTRSYDHIVVMCDRTSAELGVLQAHDGLIQAVQSSGADVHLVTLNAGHS